MTNAQKIGNKIAEARKKINISQAQLAERLFISPQAVGKWERGESMPDITTFSRLAENFGVDLNYFSENKETASIELEPQESTVEVPDEANSGKPKSKINWDLSQGNWVDADFSGLANLHGKFNSSNMLHCRFNDSDLSGLLLKSNNVDGCDFSGAEINNSLIHNSHFLSTQFKECSLKNTEFSETSIDRCDFSDAIFTETKFFKSYIYGCNLSGADFTGVVFKSGGFTGIEKPKDFSNNILEHAVWNRSSFIDTQISDLVFTGVFKNCHFENCKFTRLIFRNVTFENTFFKNNKNLKRVQFVNCEADRITSEFLKQGKADLSGIHLLL